MTIIIALALLFAAQMQATHSERYDANYMQPRVAVVTERYDEGGKLTWQK